MNTKNITIPIPEGFKIDSFDQNTGEVKLVPVPKDIRERIKSFDDVLKEVGILPGFKKEFEKSLEGLSKDEKAYKRLKLVVSTLNEGWLPDWNDSSQVKYYPVFDMRSSASGGFSYDDYDGWNAHSSVGSRLCFKSKELAEYAGKTFTDIYKDFLTL